MLTLGPVTGLSFALTFQWSHSKHWTYWFPLLMPLPWCNPLWLTGLKAPTKTKPLPRVQSRTLKCCLRPLLQMFHHEVTSQRTHSKYEAYRFPLLLSSLPQVQIRNFKMLISGPCNIFLSHQLLNETAELTYFHFWWPSAEWTFEMLTSGLCYKTTDLSAHAGWDRTWAGEENTATSRCHHKPQQHREAFVWKRASPTRCEEDIEKPRVRAKGEQHWWHSCRPLVRHVRLASRFEDSPQGKGTTRSTKDRIVWDGPPPSLLTPTFWFKPAS